VGAAIAVRGARQHNLRGWDLDIPVGQWVTVTGVSGSGKSSLAMDILYAEGQRRYLETFSPYARQFLERMDRPNVDEVRGIPPALAIEGTHPVRTSRSTVGTMTELADYLKLLYARMAVPFCPRCGKEIKRTTPDGLWEECRNWTNPTPWVLTFPIPTEGRDGELIRKGLLRMGFFRVWRDGEIVRLDDGPAPSGVETEWVVADRFIAPPESRGRFVESVEAAFRYGKGELAIHFQDGTTRRWTNQWRCIECDVVVQEPSPNLFSFNSPMGACPDCKGFGRIIDIDPDLVVPDGSKSIAEGAIRPFAVPAAQMERKDLIRFCRRSGIPVDVPWTALEEAHRKAILEGTEDYYGIKGFFRWLQGKSYKMHVRVFLSRFRAYVKCPRCQGARLRPEALRWRIGGKTLPELCAMDVESALRFLDEIQGASGENPALLLLVAEIRRRLRYLSEVGLPFLTLDRPSRTLSGGEVERVMLTRALGSNLVNTLFVLDEPSVGLHARDIERLSRVIRNLVWQGNTAVVVEHDLDMIRASDQVIDLGPGAGGRGGGLVFFGRPGQIGEKAPESVTGQYLEGTSTSLSPPGGAGPGRIGLWCCARSRRTTSRGWTWSYPWGFWSVSPAYPDRARAHWSWTSFTEVFSGPRVWRANVRAASGDWRGPIGWITWNSWTRGDWEERRVPTPRPTRRHGTGSAGRFHPQRRPAGMVGGRVISPSTSLGGDARRVGGRASPGWRCSSFRTCCCGARIARDVGSGGTYSRCFTRGAPLPTC